MNNTFEREHIKKVRELEVEKKEYE